MKLIYHTDTSINGGVSPFDEAIHQVSRSEELLIACPYIDIGYVEPFLHKCKNWRIVSDIEAWLSAFQGKSREQIANFIIANQSKIHHYEKLHAKVIVGEQLCLLGSANLTKMGITERVEMSILIDSDDHIHEIREWFETLWLESGEVDSLELQKYMQEIMQLQPPLGNPKIHLNSKSPVVKAKIINEPELQEVSKNISEVQKLKHSIYPEKVYRDKDFDERFWNIVEEAEVLWSQKLDEFIEKNGERGFFFTLGAGIYVRHLPPRHKITKTKQILSAPPGTALHYRHIAEEVVNFLHSKGVDCFYTPGIDD
jgi:hypothetical protein